MFAISPTHTTTTTTTTTIVLFFGHVHTQAEDYVSQTSNDGSEDGTKNMKKTALKVHRFNQHVAKDPRVESVMLPVFDGLTIIRKKA